jgi:hypothetical protein
MPLHGDSSNTGVPPLVIQAMHLDGCIHTFLNGDKAKANNDGEFTEADLSHDGKFI